METNLSNREYQLKKYDSNKIHQYLLSKENIDQISNKLANSSLSERKNMNGLNENRADIITAGAIILKLNHSCFFFQKDYYLLIY